jgi:hypothetical protein
MEMLSMKRKINVTLCYLQESSLIIIISLISNKELDLAKASISWRFTTWKGKVNVNIVVLKNTVIQNIFGKITNLQQKWFFFRREDIGCELALLD